MRHLLRSRKGHEHARVTFVELFFDLVFVFAITQLSHALLAHFSALGAIETLLLMMAVWWVWIYTSWITNWLDPERVPVRLMLFAIMAVGLIMSAAIPYAFAQLGLVFALAHVSIQVGRTLFMLWGIQGHASLTVNFRRILVWLCVSGVFWVLGGFMEGETRLALWILALTIEYLGPSQGFWTPGLGRSTTADWDVEGGHMAERCGLFVIIALGESVLVTGATFSGLAWSFARGAGLSFRLPRQRRHVVDLFQCRRRKGNPHHHLIRRSGPPGAPCLHLYPPLHRGRHHRDGGRR